MNKTKLEHKIRYFLEGLWLPIHAHGTGLHHLLRGHDIKWFYEPDLWNGHFGWIHCSNCPDTDSYEDSEGNIMPTNDIVIWGHYWWRLDRMLEIVCKLLGGHRDFKPTQGFAPGDEVDEDGMPLMEDIPGHWYCGRCLADVDAAVVDATAGIVHDGSRIQQ